MAHSNVPKGSIRPAPLHTRDINHKPLTLGQYHGRVLLLDYWTAHCPGCRPEIDDIVSLYKQLHPKGFDVIGICLDDRITRPEILQYVKEAKIPWRIAWDKRGWDSPLAKPYHIDSLPFLILIGRDGKIASVDPLGPELLPAVRKALGMKGRG